MRSFCYNCAHFSNLIDKSLCNKINKYTELMFICTNWKPNDNMMKAILKGEE